MSKSEGVGSNLPHYIGYCLSKDSLNFSHQTLKGGGGGGVFVKRIFFSLANGVSSCDKENFTAN